VDDLEAAGHAAALAGNPRQTGGPRRVDEATSYRLLDKEAGPRH